MSQDFVLIPTRLKEIKESKNFTLFQWGYLEKKCDLMIVFIPIVLLLVVALPFIGNGYWDDEIFSITTSQSWSGMFKVFREYENNMSLFFAILHIWMNVFGESEIATHSLSLLFAILAIIMFYGLERIWLNKTTSMMGAILLSVNPIFTFYALESRSYSLLVLSAVCSTLIFIKLTQKTGILMSVCYGLSIACALYIHYFAILIVPVHGFAFSWSKQTRSNLIILIPSGIIILLGVLPFLLFHPHNLHQLDWLPKPSLKDLILTFFDLFGGKYIVFVLFISFIFLLMKGSWKRVIKYRYFMFRLSFLWSLLPLLLIFFISIMIKPVLATRYFIWCLPGISLLFCVIIGNMSSRFVWKLAIGFMCFSILYIHSYHSLRTKAAGYKEAVKYLNDHISQNESVIAYPFLKAIHVSFYLDLIHSSKPFARPRAITLFPYLPGGGGVDPDPDMGTITRISNASNKIYVICNLISLTKVDSARNRAWLPEIEKILLGNHPHRKEIVFGIGSHEPVRMIIYE